MAAAKQRAKGRKILATSGKTHAPLFNVMDYNLSMIKALNYYSYNVDNSVKRTFAYQYWRTKGHDPKKLDSLSDPWFSTVGAVAHMVLSELPIHESDIIRLDSAYHQLLSQIEPATTTQTNAGRVVSVTTIQDRIREAARGHIGEIEGWIDDFCQAGKTYSIKEYLTKNQVKAPVMAHIVTALKPQLSEFQEYLKGEDKELVEAYSHLGKRKMKALAGYVESMINDCTTTARVARTTRMPRKRKPQPPAKVVAKLKYLKEYPDLGLKSVIAERVVDADQVWLFDTEKRRMLKYEAMEGMTLTVKGTTFQNWNPEKSGSKIIRKPEVQLKDITENGKRAMNNFFNEINGVTGKVVGRTNDRMVIVKVF